MNFVLLALSTRLVTPLAIGIALMLFLLLIGKVPLSYNFRNLAVRWRTTLLTAVAFTMVIGLLVVMLAFVNGMYQLTENSGQPGNVIVLAEGAPDEIMSSLAHADSSDLERQPSVMTDEAGNPLSSREVYLVVNQPIPTAPGQPTRRRFTQVRGLENPSMAARVHGLKLLPGSQWFSQAGVEESPVPGSNGKQTEQLIQAVVGQGLAAQWGQDRGRAPLAVGDVFELGPRRWKIVGILAADGSTFSSEVWAKKTIVGPMFGKENFSTVVLRTSGAVDAKSLAYYLNNQYKKASLQAQTETDYFSKLGESSKQFLVAIIFVVVIMAIGGVFGVMNTMFAAISARSKDIGVLRILGFGRRQILVSFMLESLLLALIGGALGCAFGSLFDGLTASSIISGSGGGGKFVVLKLLVTSDILLTGMLLALLMGAIGGLVPALSAMRLRPLESLR